jgi:spermidine synthase
LIIPFIVFLSGASVMMMEIAGSRIIAPYVGSSIHAWTALISVILGSLSIGYALGGKLADRYPSHTLLAGILFLSACAVVLIKPLEMIMIPLVETVEDVRYLAILFSLGLFSLPSILLGMISPYAIRLSLHSVSKTGRTAGNLSALSTTGSIVGTILTGFYLLGAFGHAVILHIVAGILLLCGIMLWIYGKRKKTFLLVFAGFPVFWMIQMRIPPHPLGIERDTSYQRLFIRDDKDFATNRPVRMLMIDVYGIQSAMFLDRDDDLVAEYTKVFRVADAFVPDPRRVLMIGGAGYAYPKDLLRRHPNAKIDVVEIDPGMTKAAEEYFELPQTHRLSIYHEDGRVFLLRNNSLYDVIYIDAFGELITPPFHLLTKEMFELAKKRISDNGILVMNIIGAYEGPRAKLLSAIQKTAADVFSSVQLYPVGAKAADQTQNIILVASSNPLSQALPGTKDSALKEDVSLFTDAFAPVEHYAMDMIR